MNQLLEIERNLTGSIDPDTEFGRFAARYFVDVLPWATSVILNLAKHDLNMSDDEISTQSRSLPSMIRFGVPSPEAAWCLSLGINGRRAAIEIAGDYRANGGNTDFSEFRSWFGALEIPDIRERYSFRGAMLENAIRTVHIRLVPYFQGFVGFGYIIAFGNSCCGYPIRNKMVDRIGNTGW